MRIYTDIKISKRINKKRVVEFFEWSRFGYRDMIKTGTNTNNNLRLVPANHLT